MRSLGNSTKSELYGQLYDSISEKFGGVKLPPEERSLSVWDDDGLAEEKVKKRKAELLEEYGTTEGFEAMIISWGDPNNDPVEVSPDDKNGA